ncbi:MAG TPA: xanthine dehydrogenase family protein subunit M [Gemmatimonadales bacterium]|nr:xanthine dehydrogenase family protein subunit M [Gemmatimonadales bacterium]
MKPPPFEYHSPTSLAEALAVLADRTDAKPLAGGQSLIPAMNFRLAAPAALVDLNRIDQLAGITESEGRIRIGAMTRHRAVERDGRIAARAPLLAEAMPHIAHPQIRSRGTLGGSLAHADPAAELPAVMLALDATLVLQDRAGERRIPATEFFTGLFATALRPGELVTAVEVPALAPRTGWAFDEFSRRHGDYALVGVAVMLSLRGQGRCDRVRIALLSVGDGPVLAGSAMETLQGTRPTPEAIREAAERAAREDIAPPSDIHASESYRRQLVRVLTRRALTRAAARAAGARP